MVKSIIIIFALLFLNNCSFIKNKEAETPIARVGDVFMYPSDIKGLGFENMSPKDSASLVESYINKWVQQQLLINLAEINLPENEKDVDKQLEDYRASLLIYKYEQRLLREKLDTVVSVSEIDGYYTHNKKNFLLDKNIVKGLYLKIPLKSELNTEINTLYKLKSKDEDLTKLEEYCMSNEWLFEYHNDNWIPIERLKNKIPTVISNEERFIKYSPKFKTADSLYSYYINITDYKLKGDTIPFDFIEDDIREIILNKRKYEFITNLKDEIYNDAVDKEFFTIFK